MLTMETKKQEPEPQHNGVGEITGLIGLDVGAQWELGWDWGFSLELRIDAADGDRIRCYSQAEKGERQYGEFDFTKSKFKNIRNIKYGPILYSHELEFRKVCAEHIKICQHIDGKLSCAGYMELSRKCPYGGQSERERGYKPSRSSLFLEKRHWFIRTRKEEAGSTSANDFRTFLGKKIGSNGC